MIKSMINNTCHSSVCNLFRQDKNYVWPVEIISYLLGILVPKLKLMPGMLSSFKLMALVWHWWDVSLQKVIITFINLLPNINNNCFHHRRYAVSKFTMKISYSCWANRTEGPVLPSAFYVTLSTWRKHCLTK